MLRRLVPVLAAALGAAAIVAGTSAFADGHHGHHGHHARHVSAWDKEWLMTSIQGDRFEIAGGELAQRSGRSDAVKALGARLVTDHSKSLADAVKTAQRLGIEVPRAPSPTQQWQLEVLHTFSGHAFDRQYALLEVKDHMQDIQESKDEVDMGCNRAVRELAKTDLPTLAEHLRLAEAALASVSG